MTSCPVSAAGVSGAIAWLDALAAELAGRGWAARLEAPPHCLPRLLVQNPSTAALSERVYSQPRRDGTWTYWWPWAQPIATTPAEAAAIIIGALQATDS